MRYWDHTKRVSPGSRFVSGVEEHKFKCKETRKPAQVAVRSVERRKIQKTLLRFQIPNKGLKRMRNSEIKGPPQRGKYTLGCLGKKLLASVNL